MTAVCYCENSVQYVPPDGFFGIQIVQNSISAGVPPGPRWRNLQRSLRTPSWLKGGYSLPIPYFLNVFGVSLSAHDTQQLMLFAQQPFSAYAILVVTTVTPTFTLSLLLLARRSMSATR